jgi:hypothetical protein
LKLVQERAWQILEIIGNGNGILNRIQKALQLGEIIDKWDYMRLKSFCTIKEKVTRLKGLPTEWEKIFASYISDKELKP